MLKSMKTVNVGSFSGDYTTSLLELSDTNHVIYGARPTVSNLNFEISITGDSDEIRNRIIDKNVTLVNNSTYELRLRISTNGSEPTPGFPEPVSGAWNLQAYESVTLSITEVGTTWGFVLINNSKLIETP